VTTGVSPALSYVRRTQKESCRRLPNWSLPAPPGAPAARRAHLARRARAARQSQPWPRCRASSPPSPSQDRAAISTPRCGPLNQLSEHSDSGLGKHDRVGGMRVAVRVLLALGITYCAVVVVAFLFAFAINGWGLLVLALVLGTLALRVALRSPGSSPRR
jgi:hypothetical protein